MEESTFTSAHTLNIYIQFSMKFQSDLLSPCHQLWQQNQAFWTSAIWSLSCILHLTFSLGTPPPKKKQVFVYLKNIFEGFHKIFFEKL